MKFKLKQKFHAKIVGQKVALTQQQKSKVAIRTNTT